jgi:hypothetical protein
MPADISKFLEGLEKAKKAKLEAAKKAVEGFALVKVIGDARKICPIKTGRLSDSGTVEEPTVSGAMIECVMGFNTNYAIFVHENLNAHHADGKQAKFLEVSIQNNGPKFAPFMAKEMQNAE